MTEEQTAYETAFPPSGERETDERRIIERARDAVSDMCNGSRRWTMSVPAEPDRDHDLVITAALDLASRLLVDLRRPSAPVEAGEVSVDASTVEKIVRTVLANPKSVDDYRAGKTAALGFLVGQGMRAVRVTPPVDETPSPDRQWRRDGVGQNNLVVWSEPIEDGWRAHTVSVDLEREIALEARERGWNAAISASGGSPLLYIRDRDPDLAEVVQPAPSPDNAGVDTTARPCANCFAYLVTDLVPCPNCEGWRQPPVEDAPPPETAVCKTCQGTRVLGGEPGIEYDCPRCAPEPRTSPEWVRVGGDSEYAHYECSTGGRISIATDLEAAITHAAEEQQRQLVTNATIGWHEANARAEAAERELREAREALAGVEWGSHDWRDNGYYAWEACPDCRGANPQSEHARRSPHGVGHRPDCDLARALLPVVEEGRDG